MIGMEVVRSRGDTESNCDWLHAHLRLLHAVIAEYDDVAVDLSWLLLLLKLKPFTNTNPSLDFVCL